MRRALLFMALQLAAACGTSDDDRDVQRPGLQVADVLGNGDTEGYAKALEIRTFEFPADHGAHPDFRNEWWYFTGNLMTATGRRFGYHLTFFRNRLAPPDPTASDGPVSRWRTDSVWMAHFALADVDGGRTFDHERFVRGAGGLAGVTAAPFRVHCEDWHAASDGPEELFPLRLHAEGEVTFDLTLERGRDVVLQGERGLSRKSATPGNASYYYSIPRMLGRGAVTIDGERLEVSGSGWFDREWSTSALDAGQVGWDWFALQLDGDDPADPLRAVDLMWYRMRRSDGTADPASKGLLVDESGTSAALDFEDVTLTELRHWTSPESGARYPVAWRLVIPSRELDLTVEAALDDQELDLSFRYWEGAVDVSGVRNGNAVTGHGYLEMTGYVDSR